MILRQAFGRIKTAAKKVSGLHYDALDLLRSDHMRVEALAIQLRLGRDKEKKKRLLGKIRSALDKHMRIEEEIFYPACARVEKMRGMIDHLHTDHQLIKNVLKDLAVMNPGSGQFNSLLTKAILKLEKHVHQEEDEIFGMARKYMSKAEFSRMNREVIAAHSGEAMSERKVA